MRVLCVCAPDAMVAADVYWTPTMETRGESTRTACSASIVERMIARRPERAARLKRHALRFMARRRLSPYGRSRDESRATLIQDIEVRQRFIDILMAENNRLVDQVRVALRQIQTLERIIDAMERDQERADNNPTDR